MPAQPPSPTSTERDPRHPARSKRLPGAAPTRWSGDDTGPFATQGLRPLQASALSTLRTGRRIAKAGLRGVDASDAQQVTPYPSPTVRTLASYGFIEEEDSSGVYRATDHGLHALEVLPKW